MGLQPPGLLPARSFLPGGAPGSTSAGRGEGGGGANKEEGGPLSKLLTVGTTGEPLLPLFMDVRDGPIPHSWKLRLGGLTTCPKIKEPILADSGLRPRLLTHTLPLPPQQADKLVSSVRDERPGTDRGRRGTGEERGGGGPGRGYGESLRTSTGTPEAPTEPSQLRPLTPAP